MSNRQVNAATARALGYKLVDAESLGDMYKSDNPEKLKNLKAVIAPTGEAIAWGTDVDLSYWGVAAHIHKVYGVTIKCGIEV